MDEKLPMMNNLISKAKTEMADKDPGAIKMSLLLQPSSELPTHASSLIAKYCVAFMCFFITAFSTFTVLCSTQLEQHQAWAVTFASFLGLMCVLPVLIMYRQPQSQAVLPFKVPFVPIIPAASCLINIYLMLKLSSMTWVRFGIWMLIGFSIYFTYGVWQSGMNIYDQHVVLYHAERKSMNKKTYTSYTEQHHHIEVSSNDDD